jgi:hypothetical protein
MRRKTTGHEWSKGLCVSMSQPRSMTTGISETHEHEPSAAIDERKPRSIRGVRSQAVSQLTRGGGSCVRSPWLTRAVTRPLLVSLTSFFPSNVLSSILIWLAAFTRSDVLDGHAPAVEGEDRLRLPPRLGSCTATPRSSHRSQAAGPRLSSLEASVPSPGTVRAFRTPEKSGVGDIIEPETLSPSEASSGRGWSSHVTCPRSTPFPLGR